MMDFGWGGAGGMHALTHALLRTGHVDTFMVRNAEHTHTRSHSHNACLPAAQQLPHAGAAP